MVFDGKRPFFNKSSPLYVVEFTFKKGLNEEIYENARNEVCGSTMNQVVSHGLLEVLA